MKPTLSLQIGQQLTMTPQLQQAIRLLQLSSLDLQNEISSILEANPLLEISESEQSDSSEDPFNEWEQLTQITSKPKSSDELSENALQQKINEPTLTEHLLFQWQMMPMADNAREIGELIINEINEQGYLESSLEEIHASLKQTVPLETLQTILENIQQLDPLGVGARNLKESLMIQLHALPLQTPWRAKAIELVAHYLPILGRRDYTTLRRRLQVSMEAMKAIVHLIQTLNPRPGASIGGTTADYIIPDVYVTKRNNEWKVLLNPTNIPKLRINTYYADMVKQAHSEQDHAFLRNSLQEARWLLKSLQTRNETLLKVAQCIIDKQHAFLEYGEIAMRPLILQDIASEINMHESTISRITTQKYMHTARGIYELKYFFSSHLETSEGQDCSSTAIRALIKEFIAHENRTKPLSDHQLSKLLQEQGIKIARRTIAKYREAMAILPSNERKQLL